MANDIWSSVRGAPPRLLALGGICVLLAGGIRLWISRAPATAIDQYTENGDCTYEDVSLKRSRAAKTIQQFWRSWRIVQLVRRTVRAASALYLRRILFAFRLFRRRKKIIASLKIQRTYRGYLARRILHDACISKPLSLTLDSVRLSPARLNPLESSATITLAVVALAPPSWCGCAARFRQDGFLGRVFPTEAGSRSLLEDGWGAWYRTKPNTLSPVAPSTADDVSMSPPDQRRDNGSLQCSVGETIGIPGGLCPFQTIVITVFGSDERHRPRVLGQSSEKLFHLANGSTVNIPLGSYRFDRSGRRLDRSSSRRSDRSVRPHARKSVTGDPGAASVLAPSAHRQDVSSFPVIPRRLSFFTPRPATTLPLKAPLHQHPETTSESPSFNMSAIDEDQDQTSSINVTSSDDPSSHIPPHTNLVAGIDPVRHTRTIDGQIKPICDHPIVRGGSATSLGSGCHLVAPPSEYVRLSADVVVGVDQIRSLASVLTRPKVASGYWQERPLVSKTHLRGRTGARRNRKASIRQEPWNLYLTGDPLSVWSRTTDGRRLIELLKREGYDFHQPARTATFPKNSTPSAAINSPPAPMSRLTSFDGAEDFAEGTPSPLIGDEHSSRGCEDNAQDDSHSRFIQPTTSLMRRSTCTPLDGREKHWVMAAKELYELFVRFEELDHDGDFTLTFREFRRCLGPLGMDKVIAKMLFNALDTDASGAVSFREYVTGLLILTRGDYEERLELGFKMFDRDRDGRLTREDFVAMAVHLHGSLASFRSGLQRTRSNYRVPVPRIHDFNVYKVEENASVFFETLRTTSDDADKRHISFKEYSAGLRNDPTLVRLLMPTIPGDVSNDLDEHGLRERRASFQREALHGLLSRKPSQQSFPDGSGSVHFGQQTFSNVVTIMLGIRIALQNIQRRQIESGSRERSVTTGNFVEDGKSEDTIGSPRSPHLSILRALPMAPSRIRSRTTNDAEIRNSPSRPICVASSRHSMVEKKLPKNAGSRDNLGGCFEAAHMHDSTSSRQVPGLSVETTSESGSNSDAHRPHSASASSLYSPDPSADATENESPFHELNSPNHHSTDQHGNPNTPVADVATDEYSRVVTLQVPIDRVHAGMDFEGSFPADGKIYATMYEYAPLIFQDIRRLDHIHDDQLRISLGVEQLLVNLVIGNLSTLSLTASEQKSGSCFFRSHDSKFLLKTISESEFTVLRSILAGYHKFLQEHPRSLLTKFYGLYKMRVPGHDDLMPIVLMGNVLTTNRPIHYRFDLKGSTFLRDGGRGTHKQGSLLLDMDFRRRGKRILIGNTLKHLLLEDLAADIEFLHTNGLYDYSVLIGVHEAQGQEAKEWKEQHSAIHNRKRLQVVPSKTGEEVYFIGIIDTLTRYTVRRVTERQLLRFVTLGTQEVTAAPPKRYADRLVRFLRHHVFE